jgi:hypothetical protein
MRLCGLISGITYIEFSVQCILLLYLSNAYTFVYLLKHYSRARPIYSCFFACFVIYECYCIYSSIHTLFLNPTIPIRMDRINLWPPQHASKQRQRPLLWGLSALHPLWFHLFTFETFINFQNIFFLSPPLTLLLICLSYPHLIALYGIFFVQKFALNSIGRKLNL